MKKIMICILMFLNLKALDTYEDGFNHLNKIRTNTKLNSFQWNDNLRESSMNHSNYLKVNGLFISHQQEKNRKLFSGIEPSDRAKYVGYNNSFIVENISSGIIDFKNSIDMLMTAIYHRFGFLSFNIDEIGFFRANDIITYNMGNSYILNMCNKNYGNTKVNFCYNTNFIELSQIENIKKIENENPILIVYPSEYSTNVLPSFYDETPDPIPDKDFTGNPISIQFNPSKVKSVKLLSFKLYYNNQEIRNTRILDYYSDPNKMFLPTEFALFPLDRLKWGAKYDVVVEAIVNGKTYKKEWSFHTKQLNGDIYTIKQSGAFKLNKKVSNYLYFETKRLKQFITNCEKASFVDFNTIELKVISDCIVEVDNIKVNLY